MTDISRRQLLAVGLLGRTATLAGCLGRPPTGGTSREPSETDQRQTGETEGRSTGSGDERFETEAAVESRRAAVAETE
ncbi:hypothetical protein ACFPYI_16585 [Halomarina salina]|uniref:Uncharacterized protein n=1 Tax=Halomarina salina TaxID=1872699 RepID=A0ABD5RQZ6_9EURY|nr:hypothetical protein [Halomarina salina]